MHVVSTRPPFSFDQTLAFARRFVPCHGQTIATETSLTAAFTLRGRARAVTLTAGRGSVLAELAGADDLDEPDRRLLVWRAAEWIGADDDLTALYAAAADDPPFHALARELHGLHHLRFLGLEDAAVYCVLMQRTPLTLAARYKERLLAQLGKPIAVCGRTIRAIPELGELVELAPAQIADAIGHAAKAHRIAAVVRGVATIGEAFLRDKPYAEARDALLAIPGVGPFSAAAILLRGLGRMDELPGLEMFEREGRQIYGRQWNPDAVVRRYGAQLGYWSFYLKAGAARRRPIRVTLPEMV
jgi:DNA-3-methyladenine glycosylase II